MIIIRLNWDHECVNIRLFIILQLYYKKKSYMKTKSKVADTEIMEVQYYFLNNSFVGHFYFF